MTSLNENHYLLFDLIMIKSLISYIKYFISNSDIFNKLSFRSFTILGIGSPKKSALDLSFSGSRPNVTKGTKVVLCIDPSKNEDSFTTHNSWDACIYKQSGYRFIRICYLRIPRHTALGSFIKY